MTILYSRCMFTAKYSAQHALFIIIFVKKLQKGSQQSDNQAVLLLPMHFGNELQLESL
jgi:hypothetical protein